MRILSDNDDRKQSIGEEIANGVSHGVALIAALVGTPFLIAHAALYGGAALIAGTSVFAATTIILYLSSTLYHALPAGKAKRVFRTIEHSAIFLLIAGTYTPFTLGILSGTWGWTLFGLVWGLALVGVALKVVATTSHPIFSTGLYVAMGWLIVLAINPMFARMPTEGLLLLLAGGLSYTAGVVFFMLDSRWRYGHFVWHLFVVAGTVFHYFAVMWYAA